MFVDFKIFFDFYFYSFIVLSVSYFNIFVFLYLAKYEKVVHTGS